MFISFISEAEGIGMLGLVAAAALPMHATTRAAANQGYFISKILLTVRSNELTLGAMVRTDLPGDL
jgi:hypothetical protein